MLERLNLKRTLVGLLLFPAVACAAEPSPVQFNRDVRPILADKCFRCHGPDAAARQADMRLDVREAAIADRGGYRAIQPGHAATSDLIRRVSSATADQRMPPADSGSTLSPREIDLLRRWIDEGAAYQMHWAFVPPQRGPPPIVEGDGWSRNAIDRFVRQRLSREGLVPSDEASPSTLIRRVTLDLTGLPPTREDLDAFEKNAAVDLDTAYRGLVDRLLASPRYGERMAIDWLDAARYADTNGYFTDNDRTMWPWRDWVIKAFNDNMPFDQFTVEQLAGDLLSNEEDEGLRDSAADAAGRPTTTSLKRHIATGFNRNHMVNNETGIIEEEFRVEYVVDRVDTTATVWMGLTLGCARCHDHKYDPITQRDFYRFFAFFNNLPERGLSGSSGNAAPLIKVPSVEQQALIEQLREDVADAERKFVSIDAQLDAAQAVWEKTAAEQMPNPTGDGLVAHYALDDNSPTAEAPDFGRSKLARNGPVTLVQGMIDKAAKFMGNGYLQDAESVEFDRTDAFSFGAWIQAKGAGCIISKTDDANEMRGFDVTLRKGKAIVNLVNQWQRNAIQVATATSIPSGQWQHVMITYDGSSQAAGVRVYLNGERSPVETQHDRLTGTIRNSQPLRIGRRQASASFNGLIDDVRLYNRQLSPQEVYELASSQLVRGILARPLEARSQDQQRKLRAWFVQHHANDNLAMASASLDHLRSRERELVKSVPTTMVMQESKTPRSTFLLLRGQYDQPGEALAANVPEFLRSHDAGRDSGELPASRLDLARWLVAPSHPLTARVTVNRLWQQIFGTGIVKTVDDFGVQGDWPSHPELLDWLALELIERDWDIKHLLRLIVSSATYRQSAYCRPELLHADRENRFLARGPRFRLPAETLRDNALVISGLFAERLGGPSVKPYQPAGLWEDVTYDSGGGYGQSTGESLYRRSLYTFWKRQSPPPNMLVFDATTRETCTVQRTRTNTPLQALVLMNDPTFVEASRTLAERMMAEPTGEAERIILAFRTATARRPTGEEVAILLGLFDAQRKAFARRGGDAAELLRVGASDYDRSLDAKELAAWTTVASTILSLDETITKP